MDRQFAAQHLVVEIGVQIGQDGAARLEPFDPAERIRQRQVTGMRPVAQRVDTQTSRSAKAARLSAGTALRSQE